MNIGFQISDLSGFTRVAYLWRRHTLAVLWIAMAALLPTACSDDAEQPVPQANGHTAVIYLNFKTGASKQAAEMNASQSSETRASLTRAIDENGINTVDVLSFKVDPADPTNIKKGTFFYRAQGVYDAATQSVRVRLLSDAAVQTLVVLANVRRQIDAFPASYGEQKETVMGRLLLPATSDKMPDLTSGMPMWGELPVQTINETYAQSLMTAPTVTMIRSLVKVTIENKVSAVIPPYWEGGIYVSFAIPAPPIIYNYRTNGRISPDNFNVTAQTVFAPTVPTVSGTVLPRGSHLDNPLWQEWSQLFPGSKTYIYLFEMDNSSAISSGSALDGCCLVVHGSSNDPHYSVYGYYRIDLKDYDMNTYFDLKRNYEYRIQILEIPNNPGASSPEEAFKGNDTLKCKIVPWNEVQEEVIVPGNKRLTVDKRKVEIPLTEMATGGKLTITTENTNGWTISDVTPGITFSKSFATVDGTETITIHTIPRKGSFKLKAGNAEMEIKVKREAVPLEYVAEYNLVGGFQYGSSFSSSDPSGATPNSAQTDPNLRWASSHSNDQSGFYNWYVCKGLHDAVYNPNAKNLFSDSFFSAGNPGYGYHLPSRWELTGVFSYNKIYYGTSNNTSNVNEAVEFGGIKRTFANDYYYSGNGICYALRFKQGTGSPDDNSSLSDFPKATDNRMLCAYRYTRVGTLAYDNNLTSHLKVDCVYLGESGASMLISAISNDAWWTSRSAETTTRIFPAAGYIYPAPVSGLGTLSGRGNNGCYWSGTEHNISSLSLAWLANFYSNYVNAENSELCYIGYPVRLFASE